jgi:ribonuclease BN (tRNA processing enzyme)
MRFEADGRSLVYTADTGPSNSVARLAVGADLLLSECTLSSRDGYPEEWGHLAPDEAGALASESGAHRLLLTHYWAENDLNALVRSAEQAYSGPVALAQEMETYDLD